MTQSEKTIGVVTEIYPKMCRVVREIEENKAYSSESYLCTYRRAQLIDRNATHRERSPVAPGDRVLFTPMGSKDGVIESALPRKNLLQRKAPDKSSEVLHTIACNIDSLAIVASCKDPDFSLGLVDRFLVAAIAENISPILIVTKVDLWPMQDSKPWEIYRGLGVQVVEVSIQHPESVIQPLRDLLAKKCTVFCGHSGVGKTSLLNFLSGRMDRVGSVNAVTKKGKHTTSVTKMIFSEDGTRWIDTPGIREFAVSYIDPNELIRCFPEIEASPPELRPTLPRWESYKRIHESILQDRQK